MRAFLVLFLIMAVQVSQVHSQPVSLKEAEQVAQNFFGKSQIHKSVQTCADMSIKGSDTLFYVFNADNGFIVVSGDKKVVPILAYSTESAYDADNVIPPVKMWLDSYQSQLLEIKEDKSLEQSISVSKAWEELQKPIKVRKSGTSAPTPLIMSKWGQGKFFNYYCPEDAKAGYSYNNRAVTGCVATAMAQIMYYFRYPEMGIGENTYYHYDYGELYADFSKAKYDYNAMIDNPTDIQIPTCLLMSHCGIAVEMNYGPDGSGAYSETAAYVLIDNFGYSPKTQLIGREYTKNWDSLLVSHLDNRIPLYYAGTDTARYVGHAFVCDAYQTDSNGNYYYHFNFGWDGIQDGYFYTEPLSNRFLTYHVRQRTIINAYPDTAKFNYSNPPLTGTTILTAESGSFTHGTIYDCPQNMDYTWIIRPDADDIEKIQFNMQYKLAKNDTLFVRSLKGNFNRIFTYDTANFSTDIIDTEIIVRLKTTNQQDESGGFSANYAIKRPSYCTGVKHLTANQGIVDDGSGDSRYNNFTSCRWTISVSGSSITVVFPKFETEKDKDILTIIDLAQSSRPVLAELSGNLTDSTYTFKTNRLALIFETDEKNIYQGWTLNYDTDVVGISDFEENKRIKIYPNPTTEQLKIELGELKIENVEIMDVLGRTLNNCQLSILNSQLIIDVSPLTSGIYFLKINNKVFKFVKT